MRLIGVSATNLTRASAPDLFEAPQREKLRQLSRAVDQVREKFGDTAVRYGRELKSPGRSHGDATDEARSKPKGADE